MSSRSPRLTFSPEAENELIDIQHYTIATWGKAQFLIYKRKLDEAFQDIQNIPTIGIHSRYLSPVYRTYQVEKHRIIYRVDNNSIYITRILHTNQDIPNTLT